MTDFKHPVLRELTDQQVRFAPPARRQEQVARAERLLGEVEPARVYPYQYVCFRLTDYRPDAHVDLLLAGGELKHDLALFVKRVERSLPPMPVELAAEPMLTLDEVSRQFNVSTKTVSRWRMQGLVARRVIRDGRKQLGFPKSAVEGFATAHRDQVERGARFSHLTETEKDEIVSTARRLAAEGGCLTEVSREIANRLGRSAEAVRYTIKNFDRDHPERAVFPTLTGPLDAASKTRIFTAYQEGDSVQLIAKRFGRTASSMYRVINEVRAERLVREPISYIYNAEFDDPAMVAEILGPMPNEEDFFGKVKSMRPPKDVEPHMAYLYERPLLSREQEAHMFRKMNYIKHVLARLQERIGDGPVRVPDLERIEELQSEIKAVRDLLIECNQRLVHNLATKHLNPGQNLDELKSDANVSVMRAVEKFDYGRGFKFSTYATWAIMKNFARSIPDENTRRSRYLTGTDELFDGKADIRTDEQEVLTAASQARDRVNRLLDYLDPRTREVIRMRTGLDGSEEMTLEQIGQHFGITKERVRQINVRGMKQLREKAAQENVELP
ncbi:MAG TPA: sigma-70 family RNA polymerase sigma factor [Fimbriiglobus sp.]|nr:sigma-70 family RNA polymerase sigma factor [Fimbriiglobus sp.]